MKSTKRYQKIKFKNLKGAKGITLIALVITIIVLLILAGVTIATLTGENGILTRANDSKTQTEIGEEKEAIQLAYAGIVAEKRGTGDITASDLNTEFKVNDINAEATGENTILVKFESGREYILYGNGDITLKINKWFYKDENTITDGNIEIQIGDYIKYDPITGAQNTTYTSKSSSKGSYEQIYTLEGSYDTSKYGWQVIGLNDIGEIELISEELINSTVGNVGLILQGEQGYINGINELNNIAALYGQGKGAKSARSINIDDINKLTGYDPEIRKYGYNSTQQYGNKVSYYWFDKEVPYFETANGIHGYLNEKYENQLYIYDKEKNSFILQSRADNVEDKEKIMELTSTYYTYYPETLSYDLNDDKIGLTKDSKKYKLLFENTETSTNYWLASDYVSTYEDGYLWGLRVVRNSIVAGQELVTGTNNSTAGGGLGIRVIVELDKNIELSGSSYEGWNIE